MWASIETGTQLFLESNFKILNTNFSAQTADQKDKPFARSGSRMEKKPLEKEAAEQLVAISQNLLCMVDFCETVFSQTSLEWPRD